MKLTIKLLVLTVMMGLMSPMAMADAKFSLLGGVNMLMVVDVTVLGITIGPALGFQGGAEAAFSVGKTMSVDLGAIYKSVALKTTAAGQSVTGTAGYIGIPAIFRVWLGSVIGLGAGGYYALPLDSANESDYGYLGSLRLSFGKSGLFVDGRYLGGLKDNAGVKSKGWEAYVGYTFNMK